MHFSNLLVIPVTENTTHNDSFGVTSAKSIQVKRENNSQGEAHF